jgi:hypothetical protein
VAKTKEDEILEEIDEVEGLPEDVEEEALKTESEDSVKRTGSLKDAWKQVENIGQVVGEALQSRSNVVMVRINDDALHHLDMLVEAEVTKSRSESAAYLISEGIRANAELFGKISEITDQIETLRVQLRQTIQDHEVE